MRVGSTSILCLFNLLPLFMGAVEGRLTTTTTSSDSPFDAASDPMPPLHSIPDASDDPIGIARNFISATLGDNMVLQRDISAVIWGYSQPGSTIEATLLQPKDDGSDSSSSHNVDFTVVHLATSLAEDDGYWRLTFPPQPASLTPQVIDVKGTTGETGRLQNVLFGDVYICGGQSNMAFALPGQDNGQKEADKGNDYPHIRVFTVGTGTRSASPLPDLQTIQQPWSVANNLSLFASDHGSFSYFSAVCWFFGKEVSDGLDNQVPIGLISNNWGGTRVELWMRSGDLFNAMIHPYLMGPMALTGFTWYQGEANIKDQASADTYGTNFLTMIEEWRLGFDVPEAYFGFVQLSTWCPPNPVAMAQLRQAQMKALGLPGKIGYATNADHGLGCNVHPTDKTFCGIRLANSALALQYRHQIEWQSPTYSKASVVLGKIDVAVEVDVDKKMNGGPFVVIEFQDVSDQGLYLLDNPYNNRLDPKQFNCTTKIEGTCAGPMVLLNGEIGWVDATVELQANGKSVIMKPTTSTTSTTAIVGKQYYDYGQDTVILATSYGWGSVPMMTLYDKGTDLPVLGWNEKV